MSDTFQVTSQDYWQQIREIAAHAAAVEVIEGDAHEYLHERIDGHQYVIYTGKALCVLMHTSNDDAYLDEMGELPKVNSVTELYSPLAYFAMMADVRDCRADEEAEITLGYDCPGDAQTKYAKMTLGKLRDDYASLAEMYNNLHIAD